MRLLPRALQTSAAALALLSPLSAQVCATGTEPGCVCQTADQIPRVPAPPLGPIAGAASNVIISPIFEVVAADDFTLASATNLDAMSWWGAHGTPTATPAFRIVFRDSAGAVPGNVIAGPFFVDNSTGLSTQVTGNNLFLGFWTSPEERYSYTFPSPVSLPAGTLWVEIAAMSTGNWFWENAPPGNSASVSAVSDGITYSWVAEAYDLAWCLQFDTTASPPTAAFSGTPTSGGPAPFQVTFTDESTGNPTSWLWDFGDSNTSTLQNPVHTYQTEGTFTVSLTATNAQGSDQLIQSNYITVLPAPTAAFSGTPTSGGPAPFQVTFTDESTGNPTSWLWDFGDSNTSTLQNPVHTYQTEGTFTVSLTATNAQGSDQLILSNYITVLPAPTAAFSGTPTSGGPAPLQVTFTDESTGNPTSWLWDFGDTNTSTLQNPVHTYQTEGTFTVSLTATNAQGSDQLILSNYISVLPAPTAAFSGTPTSGGPAPFQVTFTDESTGNPTSWLWDFGDSNTSTLQNPVHTYQTEGTFTVSLTATNAQGSDQLILSNYITVLPAPTAAFSGTPTSGGPAPFQVTFTDESTGDPTSWLWDFGDSNTSTLQNPVHTYQTEGTFTVSLTATNAQGSDQLILSNYITVLPAPTAAFSGTPTSGGPAPFQVTFTDESTGNPTSWLWDFGDSNTSTLQNPVHTYQTEGTFTVSLTATNAQGSDQLILSNYITVLPAPTAAFSGTPTIGGPPPFQVTFTDESTGNPTSWLWDFGDGGTSTLQNPVHTYITGGTFSVSITATNAQGSDQLVLNNYISVSGGPCVATTTDAWWDGDVVEGISAFDLSGNDNHGTLENGASTVAGLVGNAFSFDGVDDRVVVLNDPSLNPNTELSIEFWLNPVSIATPGQFLIGMGDSDPWSIQTRSGTGDFLDFEVQTNTILVNVEIPTASITNAAYHHIAAVFESSTGRMELWLNGVLIDNVPKVGGSPTSVLGAIMPVSSTTVCLGCDSQGTGFFQGELDEVSVYQRALSPFEIATIFAANSDGKCKPVCQSNLGFQSPGTASASLCGTGLNTGQSSDYEIAGAPSSAAGALFVSAHGAANFPVAGGTLVAFAGFLIDVPINADANGRYSLTLNGAAVPLDVVLQSLFIDLSLPQGLAFTNAVRAQFGI